MDSQGLIPFWVFALFWVAYGFAGLPLSFGRNLQLKRRWFRPYIVGGGFLFITGMALTGFPIFMVLIAAPLVIGIVALQLKVYRFCTRCGATAFWTGLPFQRTRFCGSCGAELTDDKTKGASDPNTLG